MILEFFVGLMVILPFLAILRIYFAGGICKIVEDLANKVVVITGANSGIGMQTAIQLAKQNATIIMACRDLKKGEQVKQQIKKISKNGNIFLYNLDLADLRSIEQFAIKIKSDFKVIDILINNAGIMFLKNKTLTKQGLEMQVGVNYIGHFYLTNQLIDLIKNSQDGGRIINLASVAYQFFWQLKLNNLNSEINYHSFRSYCYSKQCMILYSQYQQELFDQQNLPIKIVAVHPGLVNSQIQNELLTTYKLQFLYKLAMPFLSLIFKSTLEGCQTTLHCCMENFDKLQGGGYYSDCKTKNLWKFARDHNLMIKLYQQTLQYIKSTQQAQ